MLSVFLVSLAAGQSWEWAGVFATPDDSYTWIAQKATGTPKDYADPTMKLVVLSAATADGAGLENVRTKGNTAMAATCTAVSTGGEITPTDGACFTLTFDASAAETTFTIKATGVANIAFFAQHFPTEFEDTKHYFQTTAGADVEPAAEEAVSGEGGHSHGGGSIDHGNSCGCEQDGDFKFTIDC